MCLFIINLNFIFMTKKVIISGADGVFNFGAGVSKTVLDVFAKWMNEGRRIYILSNTTATNEATEKSYAKAGVIKGVHYTDLLTSGQFAYEDIKAGNLPVAGNKYYIFGTANFKRSDPIPDIFKDSMYERVDDVSKADFIYCGIPQIKDADGGLKDSVHESDFTAAVQQLALSGKPMIVANPDMRANEGGHFVVRQGIIGRIFERAGGKVIYYGKPDPRIYELLLKRYCPKVKKRDIVMIGATCLDIKGAKLAGIEAILTLEGGVAEYEMKKLGLSLDAYLARQEVMARPWYVWKRIPDGPLFQK